MTPRITLIGAGSVEFTRILLADLSAFPELTEATIVLHDINPDRLETAEQIATAANRSANANFRIESHLDRRAALAGADFVINEIQVGGFDATLRDFEIPKRYGLRQTIADTLGVGGVFRALRTIPVVLDIADDMDQLCPEAMLLNYTNPMAMLCWALWASGRDTRIVGLCHSVQNTHEQLADGLARRVRIELYRQFGHFPTESSEHSAEYLPWFMSHDDQLERYRIPVDEYIRRSQDNLREYEEIKRALAAGEQLPLLHEGELAPRYVHAMVTGQERIEYGNVRNDGLITNLPDGCCVEVPCRIDSEGVHPVAVGALPPQCAALNRTMVNVADLTVSAVLEGRRDHVYQAVLLDPNAGATLTIAEVHDMVDELIEAHGDLMPAGIRTAARV
jgi:alpha-galactosidase